MDNDILRLAIQRKMTSFRVLADGLIEISVNAVDQLTEEPVVIYSSVFPPPEELRKQADELEAEEQALIDAHRAKVALRRDLADLVETVAG